MKNLTIRSFLSLPVLTLGILTFTSPAQAAALTGEFQFSGGFTNVDFSQNSLIFGEAPEGQNSIILTPGSQTESFAAFNVAFIRNIELVPNTNPDNNPFLDLELTSGSSGDGVDVFNLTEVGSFGLSQSGVNVAIDLPVFGEFVSATNDITLGQGNLTFQINDTDVNTVQTQLVGGFVFENIGFSGAAFTTANSAGIPEPSTLLGLGFIVSSLLVSRRRS